MTKEIVPEKRLFEISIKLASKVFLFIVAIIGYFQLSDYLRDKIPASIELTRSETANMQFKSYFEFYNKNSALDKGDFQKPLKIILSDSIINISIEKKIQEKFGIELSAKNDKIFMDFDLLNKNESFTFQTLSNHELEIKELRYRIKDVDAINFYHFKYKPRPLYRILQIWLFTLVVSIFLFVDALLVVLKDKKLGELKKLVFEYDLTLENKDDFFNKYKVLYNEYPIRIKAPSFFVAFKIKNLLDSFHKYNESEIRFLRFAISYYTEFFVLYRLRTTFLIISPILFAVSIIGICLNYFYYEIPFLRFSSLETINNYILKFILIVFLVMIVFPRQTMNYFLIKREARNSGNVTRF